LADYTIVKKSITGWSIAREVALPFEIDEGFCVNVGWPKQVKRYVFPSVTPEFPRLANTIQEPWHFLKVCAEPEVVAGLLPPRWVIQPIGYMMTCDDTTPAKTLLANGYNLQVEHGTVSVARILTADGVVAAIGRVVIVDDYAIYDRIETHSNHRRKGLGSAVMAALNEIAINRGVNKGVLVATEQGMSLYGKLGWALYSVYTTAVIPGNE